MLALENKTLQQYSESAGSGVLTGQGFALAGSLFHSMMHAPPGGRISNCASSFLHSSYQTGVSMATWSIVNATVEPIVSRYLEQGFLKSVVSSATTGALTEIRNGPSGMLNGAMTGVMQSVFMSGVQQALVTVARPVMSYRREKVLARFSEQRNKEVFGDPFDVLSSAFGW